MDRIKENPKKGKREEKGEYAFISKLPVTARAQK